MDRVLLTLVEVIDKNYAIYKCECGVTKKILIKNVKPNHTRSCGCLQKQRASQANTKHGKHLSGEYKSWHTMKQRCTNPNCEQYKDYGGRGINYCVEWETFENFYKDMGKRPSKHHTLERKDNNKGYCKENCKWATKKEQARNTRSNRILEYNGEKRTMAEWSEILNLPKDTIRGRLDKLDWPIEKALSTPYIKDISRDCLGRYRSINND